MGDYILPADETGASSVSGDFGAPYRTDRVYITTSEAAARSYAALTIAPELIDARRRGLSPAEARKVGGEIGGAVYEVEPGDDLVSDADEADHSWEAVKAKIVRVVDAAVPPPNTKTNANRTASESALITASSRAGRIQSGSK
ncbi:MAG: hypothetical protein ACLP0J_14145 [Solirubrobacteraceae bacterium]